MTKIKICGLSREEDIEYVNEYKPDYAGFVFYAKSHRYVTVARALELKRMLDASIKPVAVFLHATDEEIVAPVAAGVTDIVQLHGNITNEDIDRIRQLLPEGTTIIQALKIAGSVDIELANASKADMVLLDNGLGGTGESFDWSLLAGVKREYFLAGGLNPDNVAGAIDTAASNGAAPYAVDVSSGVESDKIKDHDKIARFCEAVRGTNSSTAPESSMLTASTGLAVSSRLTASSTQQESSTSYSAGLVLEGGAIRGIFSAGVVDYLMEQNVELPYVIGVSAGSGIAANYCTHQIGRAKKVISHEGLHPYFGIGSFFRCGKFLNMKELVYDYSLKNFPYDFDAFFKGNKRCECVAIECESGECRYFGEYEDRDYFLKVFQASCSVPFVSKPVKIDGKHYLDGSLSDSIPVKRAIEAGCEKLLVVLTKPVGGKPTDYSKMKRYIKFKYHKYPNLIKAMLSRTEVYREQAAMLEKLVAEGKALVIRPEGETIEHFEKDPERIEWYYQDGRKTAERHLKEIRKFLEQ